MQSITEEQVIDYIKDSILKSMEMNKISKQDAVESVRYYIDYLVNESSHAID